MDMLPREGKISVFRKSLGYIYHVISKQIYYDLLKKNPTKHGHPYLVPKNSKCITSPFHSVKALIYKNIFKPSNMLHLQEN